MKLPRLLALVLGSFTLLAAACGGGGDSKATVQGFFDAFNDRDADKIYDSFSSSCLQGITKDQFNQGWALGASFIGDSKAKIESIDVKEDGDNASATVKGKFEGGPLDGADAQEDTLDLKKEDGKWKIADCSFIQGLTGPGG